MDEDKKVTVTLNVRRPEDFRLFFTNHVQVSGGNTGEVQVFFGQMLSPILGQNPETIAVDQSVGVVMTLREYKNMLKVFNGHLAKLEEIARDIENDE